MGLLHIDEQLLGLPWLGWLTERGRPPSDEFPTVGPATSILSWPYQPFAMNPGTPVPVT